MILLIDIGNSRLKWVSLEGKVISPATSIDYRRESDDNWFPSVTDSLQAIYIASVADKGIEQSLIKTCQKRWGVTPYILQTEAHCAGLKNGYRDPSQLGIDRWAAMIGAYQLYETPILVVDCGTACTADVIAADGSHLGGAIIPGANLMRQSLYNGASSLRAAEQQSLRNTLGRDSAGCIDFGVMVALAGFIERMERYAKRQLQTEPTVVLSGGNAHELLPYLGPSVQHEELLVFHGMERIVSQLSRPMLS